MLRLPVVVGIIKNKNNEVLIAKRPSHFSQGGLWEFPGGKIEKNETPLQALQRELKEELALHTISADFWFHAEYAYPDKMVLLDHWIVTKFSGELVGNEGQEIRWVHLDSLHTFSFLAGSTVALNKLITHSD